MKGRKGGISLGEIKPSILSHLPLLPIFSGPLCLLSHSTHSLQLRGHAQLRRELLLLQYILQSAYALSWISQPFRRRTELSIGTLLMHASLICM